MKLVLAAAVVMAGCAGPMEQEPFVLPAEEREAALRYADEVPFTWDAPRFDFGEFDEELRFGEAEPGFGGFESEQHRLLVFVKAGADVARVVAASEARWCPQVSRCSEPTLPIIVPYSVLEQRSVMGWLKASPVGPYTSLRTPNAIALPGFAGAAYIEVSEEVLDVAHEVLQRGGVPADAYRLRKMRIYQATTGATAPAGG